MIYLASPYSHPSAQVRKARFNATQSFVAYCYRNRLQVFSPIVYSHQFVQYGLGTSAGDWDFLNREVMEWCAGIWVLKLEGWQESVGIAEEIRFFQSRGIQPEYKEFRSWHE